MARRPRLLALCSSPSDAALLEPADDLLPTSRSAAVPLATGTLLLSVGLAGVTNARLPLPPRSLPTVLRELSVTPPPVPTEMPWSGLVAAQTALTALGPASLVVR
jgi:hypothetical protein